MWIVEFKGNLSISFYMYYPPKGTSDGFQGTKCWGLVFYAPNCEKVGDILVFGLSVWVCVCACVRVCVRACVCSSWKIADAYFWFFLNYLPLLNYGPLTNKGMKFCKCRISKSIIARNLKL